MRLSEAIGPPQRGLIDGELVGDQIVARGESGPQPHAALIAEGEVQQDVSLGLAKELDLDQCCQHGLVLRAQSRPEADVSERHALVALDTHGLPDAACQQARSPVPPEGELRMAQQNARLLPVRGGAGDRVPVHVLPQRPPQARIQAHHHQILAGANLLRDIGAPRHERIPTRADVLAIDPDVGEAVQPLEHDFDPVARSLRGQHEGPGVPPILLLHPL